MLSPGCYAANERDANVERRIIDAPGVALQARSGTLPLGSFRLEMTARQPRFDGAKKQVVMEVWRLAADLERDNVFVVCNIKASGTGEGLTLEGWIMGGARPGGVPYEMTGGKLDVSPRLQHQCWMRAYAWTPALSAAASGHSAARQERIDGRSADKYLVEAPASALDRIRPMMNLSYAKGAVWLDRETGALLKASIDYGESFTEQRGSDKVAATGDGHVEMLVTHVGKVALKLPK